MVVLNNWCVVKYLGHHFVTGNAYGHPVYGDSPIRTSPIDPNIDPSTLESDATFYTTGGHHSDGNLYKLGYKLDGDWVEWCIENDMRYLTLAHKPYGSPEEGEEE